MGWSNGRRVVQREEIGSAKALRRKHAWYVPERLRSLVWQEQNEQGEKE